MFVVSLSEFPNETFILIEDGEKDTRASVKARIQAQKQQQEQQNLLMSNNNGNSNETTNAPLNNIAQLQTSLQKTSTRYTLFTASTHYPLLLSRLNLPPALGAPSMGDGVSSTHAAAGPGAWLPRGGSIIIEGATYELPSATRYGVEETAHGSICEWRVRLGMLQSGASRGSGAIVEVSKGSSRESGQCEKADLFTPLLQYKNEYLPLLRLSDPMLLLSHLHSLFPPYLTNPSQEAQVQTMSNAASVHYPSPEQWDEVIPASNEGWVENLDKMQGEDQCGWKGKERGRRLAYLYITLLRAQGLL
jgi:hypothetical protein